MKSIMRKLVALFAFTVIATAGIIALDPSVVLGLNVEWVMGFTAHTDGLVLANVAAAGVLNKEQLIELTETIRKKFMDQTKESEEKLQKNLAEQIGELEGKITEGIIKEIGVAELKEKSAKMSDDNAKFVEDIQAEVKKYADEINEKLQKLDSGPSHAGDEPVNFGKGLTEVMTKEGMDSGKAKKRADFSFKQWPVFRRKDVSVADTDVYQREMVPGIIGPAQRQLRIRDLLPVLPTSNNAIYFGSETALTDAAAPVATAAAKPESTFQITSANESVRTIAHFIQVPLQLLDDIPALEAYINSRMMFMLEQEEEDQLLYGSGSGQNLNGLITQATLFDASLATELGVTDETDLDKIALAIAQVQVAQYPPTGVVMHPYNFAGITLLKESTRGYVYSNPFATTALTLWGLPVVSTVAISSPDFLVGAFNIGAAIWDRQKSNIAISTEDSTNFQLNLATIRAEERIALTVYRTLSFVQGDFANTIT